MHFVPGLGAQLGDVGRRFDGSLVHLTLVHGIALGLSVAGQHTLCLPVLLRKCYLEHAVVLSRAARRTRCHPGAEHGAARSHQSNED